MCDKRVTTYRKCILPSAVLLLHAVAAAQTGPCATPVPGQPLPDLIVDAARLKADLLVSNEKFNATSCAVVEGCVSSKGAHQVLRFSSSTPNIGQGDLVIGDPNLCPNLFHLSECHNHFHFNDYSAYRLWTQMGYQNWVSLRDLNSPANAGINAILLANATASGDLIVGRKQGFCMIDSERYLSTASTTRKYTLCGGPGAPGNQGIQVGWTDVYGQQLDCQYIEIDHLRDGIYVVEVQVNPDRLIPETDYTNNFGAVTFQFIGKRGNTPAQVIPQ
jgi:hypothetical protein